jgi:hypothetical protein
MVLKEWQLTSLEGQLGTSSGCAGAQLTCRNFYFTQEFAFAPQSYRKKKDTQHVYEEWLYSSNRIGS